MVAHELARFSFISKESFSCDGDPPEFYFFCSPKLCNDVIN